jgi:hypothetical protein
MGEFHKRLRKEDDFIRIAHIRKKEPKQAKTIRFGPIVGLLSRWS